MGIYDKRKSISRRDLSSILRKHHGKIPGTGGKKYYEGQRRRMTGDVFGPKYGSQIDKQEYRHVIRKLQSDKRTTKTVRGKAAIDKKIRYLEEFGGKNVGAR